jgi:hypothetical protein
VGDHSRCLHGVYDKPPKIDSNNTLCCEAIDNFLLETCYYFDIVMRSRHTQLNESLNSKRERKAKKDIYFRTSWSARAALALVEYNEPIDYYNELMKYLEIRLEEKRMNVIKTFVDDLNRRNKKKHVRESRIRLKTKKSSQISHLKVPHLDDIRVVHDDFSQMDQVEFSFKNDPVGFPPDFGCDVFGENVDVVETLSAPISQIESLNSHEDETLMPIVVLPNIDNCSCHFNASVILLLSIDVLRMKILSTVFRTPILNGIQNLLRMMILNRIDVTSSIDLQIILSEHFHKFSNYFGKFSDSSETFSMILEAMDSEDDNIRLFNRQLFATNIRIQRHMDCGWDDIRDETRNELIVSSFKILQPGFDFIQVILSDFHCFSFESQCAQCGKYEKAIESLKEINFSDVFVVVIGRRSQKATHEKVYIPTLVSIAERDYTLISFAINVPGHCYAILKTCDGWKRCDGIKVKDYKLKDQNMIHDLVQYAVYNVHPP